MRFVLRSIHHEYDTDQKNYDLSANKYSFIIKSNIDDIDNAKFTITSVDEILSINEANKERSKYLY